MGPASPGMKWPTRSVVECSEQPIASQTGPATSQPERRVLAWTLGPRLRAEPVSSTSLPSICKLRRPFSESVGAAVLKSPQKADAPHSQAGLEGMAPPPGAPALLVTTGLGSGRVVLSLPGGSTEPDWTAVQPQDRAAARVAQGGSLRHSTPGPWPASRALTPRVACPAESRNVSCPGAHCQEQPRPRPFPSTHPGGPDRGGNGTRPPPRSWPLGPRPAPPPRRSACGRPCLVRLPPSGPRVLQEAVPPAAGEALPGWVLAACALLSFLPTLWVPVVALGQLPGAERRRGTRCRTDARSRGVAGAARHGARGGGEGLPVPQPG